MSPKPSPSMSELARRETRKLAQTQLEIVARAFLDGDDEIAVEAGKNFLRFAEALLHANEAAQ